MEERKRSNPKRTARTGASKSSSSKTRSQVRDGEAVRRRRPASDSNELARRRQAAAKARRARELKKKKQRRKAMIVVLVLLLAIIGAGIGVAYAMGVFVNPLEKGTQQLKDKEYAAAIATFEKASGDKDKAAEAYEGIGMANWELKKYEECKDAYMKALDAGAAKTGTIYNFMALCDMQAEDYDSALSNITAALDCDGNNDELTQELKYNEIVVYEKQKDWENAKAKMSAYTSAYPDDETAAREAQFLETR